MSLYLNKITQSEFYFRRPIFFQCMKSMHPSFLVILVLLGPFCSAVLSTTPTWLTSSYLQAGTQAIFDSLTGNDENPEFLITFAAGLTGVPRLAYGIKNYRGNDYMGIEQFEISKIAVSALSFALKVIIAGTTNIWVLETSYIAIDPSFPHSLNSFDNVPVNYGCTLTNITTKNPAQISFYQNIINYTTQAQSTSSYSQFSLPLENNKILLYMSALNIWSTNEGTSATWYPITLQIDTQILSSSTYAIRVSLSYNVMVSILEFSMIVFNIADVQNSHKYAIVFQRIDFPKAGGFYALQSQYVGNFMMGLLDFSTLRGQSVLHYSWKFSTLNGIFGVQMEQSVPKMWQTLGVYALERQGSMLFYLKKWSCPSNMPFFNTTTNLCQDHCNPYFAEKYNLGTFYCQPCPYSCMECSAQGACLSCNQAVDHRRLLGSISCECMDSYFDNGINRECEKCTTILPGCISCFYNTSYVEGDLTGRPYGCWQCSTNYYLADFACEPVIVCPLRFLANHVLNICEPCPTGCLTCDTSTCFTCEIAAGYFLNTSTQLCQPCSIPHCQTCTSLVTCHTCTTTFINLNTSCVCSSHQYYDTNYHECRNCSQYCYTCSGPSAYQCTSCDYVNQKRVLKSNNCICDPYNYQQAIGAFACSMVNPHKCDYGSIYLNSRRSCKKVCTANTTSSSSSSSYINTPPCIIQLQIYCQLFLNSTPHISNCILTTSLFINKSTITLSSTDNILTLALDLFPQPSDDEYNFYQGYDWSTVVTVKNGDEVVESAGQLAILQAEYLSNGTLVVDMNYTEDMEDSQLQMHLYEAHYNDEDLQKYQRFGPQEVDNIIITLNHDKSSRSITNKERTSWLLKMRLIAVVIMSIALLASFICLLLKNSLSTILVISALQQGFLALSAIDRSHPQLPVLKALKPMLGYSYSHFMTCLDSRLPDRVRTLLFSQCLLNNINVMLLLQVVAILATGALYIAYRNGRDVERWFRIIQKQSFLLAIFNLPNATFSLAIIKQPVLLDKLLAVFVGLMMGCQLLHGLLRGSAYLDFSQTLRIQNFGKTMSCVLMVRVLACVILAANDKNPSVGVIGISILQMFLIFMLLHRKMFTLSFNNYCNILGQLLLILVMAAVYLSQQTKFANTLLYIFMGLIAVIASNLFVSLCWQCNNSKAQVKDDDNSHSFQDIQRVYI